MKTAASVLVLNFNGKRYLNECFSSLQKQSRLDFEVWLVDNGSTDGSVEFVREAFPQVRILALEKNYGFCAAYNQAVAVIQTPFAVFLNNDTAADPRWLEHLMESAENERAGIVGSKILSYEKRNMILSAGLIMTPAGVSFEKGLGMEDSPGSPYSRSGPVAGVSGASMLVRTEVFRDLGGFDEGYFAFCEDLDLGWRFNLMGHKVFYEPKSVVYHWSGGTAGGHASGTRVYYMQKNMIRTALKHFETWNWIKALGVMGVYTLLRFILNVATGKFDLAWALLSGSGEPIRDFPRIWNDRSRIQRSRIVSDQAFRERGWICSVWTAYQEYIRTRPIGSMGRA